MSARPLVRSTSWSGTTTAPGPFSGFRLPTAHGPKTRRTPSLRSAHMLARYGTVCAENSWAGAVPGQERDLVLADSADRDRGAGLGRTGCRRDGADVGFEEGVEAAAADDSEHPPIVVHAPVRSRARGCGHPGRMLVASFAQWISGARPRTLPNAVAPVIAGTGAAAWLHSAVWWKALLALAVARRADRRRQLRQRLLRRHPRHRRRPGRPAAPGGLAAGDPAIGADRGGGQPDGRRGGRAGAGTARARRG